jgi:hypothetical protein
VNNLLAIPNGHLQLKGTTGLQGPPPLPLVGNVLNMDLVNIAEAQRKIAYHFLAPYFCLPIFNIIDLFMVMYFKLT